MEYSYGHLNPVKFVEPNGHSPVSYSIGKLEIPGSNITATGCDPLNLTRVAGVFQAIGGFGEAVAGYGFAFLTAETGVGVMFGASVGTPGVDQLQAGLRKLITGQDTDTLTSTVMQNVEVPKNIANLTDAVISIGGVGTIGKIKAMNNIVNSWKFGEFKTLTKWNRQMAKRGWTDQQITEAMNGEQFTAENLVNKSNTATRYVHPDSGRSVVIDDVTKEVIHVGGNDFKY